MEVADRGHDRHASDRVHPGDGHKPGHHRIGRCTDGQLLASIPDEAEAGTLGSRRGLCAGPGLEPARVGIPGNEVDLARHGGAG